MTAELLAQWGPPVLGVVFSGGLAGFLAVIFNRRLTNAQAGKATVEGDVAQSSDQRAWVAQANERAAAAERAAASARADADASRRSAWAAEDTAARCRREVDELRDLIRDCARAGCPIRPLVAGRDDNRTGGP